MAQAAECRSIWTLLLSGRVIFEIFVRNSLWCRFNENLGTNPVFSIPLMELELLAALKIQGCLPCASMCSATLAIHTAKYPCPRCACGVQQSKRSTESGAGALNTLRNSAILNPSNGETQQKWTGISSEFVSANPSEPADFSLLDARR